MGELIKNLRLNFFDNQDIISVIDTIDMFDHAPRLKLLVLCLILSDATPSIIPGTLKRVQRVALTLDPDDLVKWIDSATEVLNGQGTGAFFQFISNVDAEHLKAFISLERLRLKDITDTLQLYIKGISGHDFSVGADIEPSTDMDTIYLPAVLSRFKRPGDNLIIYLLMAAHKWAQIACGTLNPDMSGALAGLAYAENQEESVQDLENFFNAFPQRELAIDLFTLLEAFMLDTFLRRELPGLMERAAPLKDEVYNERPSLEDLSEKTAFVEGIYHFYLSGATKGTAPAALLQLHDRIMGLRHATDPREVMKALITCYQAAVKLKGEYEPQRPVFFLGTIKPDRIAKRLRTKRNEMRKKLEGMIEKLLKMPPSEHRRRRDSRAVAPQHPVKPEEDYLVIKGQNIALNDAEKDQLKGGAVVHEGNLVKGSNLASGSVYVRLEDNIQEEEVERKQEGGIAYDEWDYHRGDYKKDWCIIYEQELQPGDEPFVELTLKKYRGYVTQLRKKFETLKTSHRRVKKQKDGDVIDLDAAIEALSDRHAGLSPEDTIYASFNRNTRDIAVLFLVDMSGSTKGWVNIAEKEALVLMCEALESLGDRYAIYGFSGMTRTRCDYFHIKSFSETYSEEVKRRIAGITPRDYTRMGAPVRNSATVLRPAESRTKFLITLSDGRPEDWGSYKGDYGIEDTRKALLEAREKGIRPFCITIDKEAGLYLPHLFGEANYIVIDDVRKLPGRIVEIYRGLTV
jgi:nitric oxide reductase NorD protein